MNIVKAIQQGGMEKSELSRKKEKRLALKGQSKNGEIGSLILPPFFMPPINIFTFCFSFKTHDPDDLFRMKNISDTLLFNKKGTRTVKKVLERKCLLSSLISILLFSWQKDLHAEVKSDRVLLTTQKTEGESSTKGLQDSS